MRVTNFINNQYNITIKQKKELNFSRTMTLISYDGKNGFVEPVQVDIFSNQHKIYASIHVFHKDVLNAGCGVVYERQGKKQSEALQLALNSAGIELDEDISARCDLGMIEALNAIAEHLKLKDYKVVNRGY